jgi:hypothetical protein
MRLPRISVGLLMAMIVFIGVQIAVFRFQELIHHWFVGLCVIPVCTVFGLGALLLVHDLLIKRKTPAFLTGFELFGGLGLCFAIQFQQALDFVLAGFMWSLGSLAGNYESRVITVLFWLVTMAIFTSPIFVLAVAGGLLAEANELTLSMRRRRD